MKNRRLTLRQKRAITGLLFITPWLIGFIVYYLRSFVLTTQFSLSYIKVMDTGGYTATFVGLDNYKYALLEHTTFNQVLTNSIRNVLIDVPFITFFSLFIALLLNAKFKGRGLVRAIFFLPILLGSGAVKESLELATEAIQGGATTMISDIAQTSGLNVDYFLDVLLDIGIPDRMVDYIISIIGRIYEVVRASGIQIIIFIAALQSVSPSLYEVSKIEGATPYETFWKVTFPMVSPLIITNVVYTIVDYFVNSDVVELAYNTAFGSTMEYGLSSAMSMLSTVSICTILAVIVALISRKAFYYN
jgi:ABC-type sugar transport system permease subunit